MTPVQIDQIIADYVRANLSPKKPERDIISKRYEQLESMLSGRTFQNGSYARHTSTTPVNDLDVFYILPESVRKMVLEKAINPEELTIDNILDDLAEALGKEYGNEAKIITQPHSVGIFFGSKNDFSIDVVPAQPADNGLYWVPESALRSVRSRRVLYESISSRKINWIKSHPKGYIDQATALDDSTKGVFRKAAKFVKKWNRGCKNMNNSFPLKSFHAEIMVTEVMKAQKGLLCFGAIQRFFSILPDAVARPQYRDMADLTRYIDSYVSGLTEQEKSLVINEHQRAVRSITEIQSATSEAQVLRSIQDLLNVSTTGSTSVPLVTVGVPRTSPAYSKPYYW